MDEKSIIDNLERVRQENGLSQNEVAEKIGISRNTYVNLVSGKTKVINEYLQPLSELFGITLEELLLGYRPAKTSETRLQELNDFEEMRLALVNRYENELSSLKDKLRDKDETIIDLRNHIKTLQEINSMQKRQLGE
ncbi:MAG: helix-turn-helix domain-containing protein [Bacteroidales bacterium]|nr:helix-turn-helix domain-containing protein [Bacteroidales bacterium]